ncbi:hypothetical protein CKO38_01485 [Rhodospirillum rubrum]|uniref:hypothetical protein n=1 Tax=Rhodospirillum rubrum TaxID=1085 RepID=UPI0019074529|nr:hypothetical protein [Rhodospirillum rubrum]MBK1663449.1 hypothetical protein [Rhodospirillum rubrum]MBK1675368.1 hypothetical protein [Rhodospirillum rubrum]
MRLALLYACFVPALAVFAGPAAAQSICAAPLTPVCMEPGGVQGDDALSKQRCIEDMKGYLGQQRDYVTCLRTNLAQSETNLGHIQARIEGLKNEISTESRANAQDATKASD